MRLWSICHTGRPWLPSLFRCSKFLLRRQRGLGESLVKLQIAPPYQWSHPGLFASFKSGQDRWFWYVSICFIAFHKREFGEAFELALNDFQVQVVGWVTLIESQVEPVPCKFQIQYVDGH